MGVDSNKINVGQLDRIIRIVVGLLLTILAITNTIGVWGWLGLILLVTGLMRFCLVYALFGTNTCDKKEK